MYVCVYVYMSGTEQWDDALKLCTGVVASSYNQSPLPAGTFQHSYQTDYGHC